MSQNNLSVEDSSMKLRVRKPVKQFKMGEAPRGISSNSLKSSKSNLSSNISVQRIQANQYENDDKAKLKRARTLKQEPADRVIEEDSQFDDSGSGFASDTPIAGVKRKAADIESFGDAIIPKKRKIKKGREEISYKINSAS